MSAGFRNIQDAVEQEAAEFTRQARSGDFRLTGPALTQDHTGAYRYVSEASQAISGIKSGEVLAEFPTDIPLGAVIPAARAILKRDGVIYIVMRSRMPGPLEKQYCLIEAVKAGQTFHKHITAVDFDTATYVVNAENDEPISYAEAEKLSTEGKKYYYERILRVTSPL